MIDRTAQNPAPRAGIAAEFDAKAETYEDDRLSGWYQAQGALVKSLLDPIPSGTILDIGCGTGWLLRDLVRDHAGAHGLGLDLSSGMIAVARQRAAAEGLASTTFVHGDWEDDDTWRRMGERASSPIVAIVCVSAFHYFRAPAAALRRMYGCLAPGGQLLLVERAKDGSPLTSVWDHLHRWVIRDGARFYRTAELLALLREAGFADAHVAATVRRYFWKGKLHTSLAVLQARRSRPGEAVEMGRHRSIGEGA